MLPFAGYIRRKLIRTSAVAADAGALALGLGAIGLILAGLIVSHPAQGTSVFPRLHEMLAYTAAGALGAAMIVFWVCAAKGYLNSPAIDCEWRRLLVAWSLVTLPALSVAIPRAAAAAHLHWSNPIYQALESRALWRLGFWEWLGSAAVYLYPIERGAVLATRQLTAGTLSDAARHVPRHSHDHAVDHVEREIAIAAIELGVGKVLGLYSKINRP